MHSTQGRVLGRTCKKISAAIVDGLYLDVCIDVPFAQYSSTAFQNRNIGERILPTDPHLCAKYDCFGLPACVLYPRDRTLCLCVGYCYGHAVRC